MTETCAKWRCDNPTVRGTAFCSEHPPLRDHGLAPNTVTCPECGEVGAGTIHDDVWYCLDKYGFDGCGELFDPYEVAGVEKEPKWSPGEP